MPPLMADLLHLRCCLGGIYPSLPLHLRCCLGGIFPSPPLHRRCYLGGILQRRCYYRVWLPPKFRRRRRHPCSNS